MPPSVPAASPGSSTGLYSFGAGGGNFSRMPGSNPMGSSGSASNNVHRDNGNEGLISGTVKRLSRIKIPFRAPSLLDKTKPYFSGIKRFGISKVEHYWKASRGAMRRSAGRGHAGSSSACAGQPCFARDIRLRPMVAQQVLARLRAVPCCHRQPESANTNMRAGNCPRCSAPLPRWLLQDPFHTLLNLPWPRFILIFFMTYMVEFMIFAFLFWVRRALGACTLQADSRTALDCCPPGGCVATCCKPQSRPHV